MNPFLIAVSAAPLVLAAPDALRGQTVLSNANTSVAEIVTFQLVEGADETDFLQAAQGMSPFLRSTGAMVSRTLSKAEDGTWTDHLTWTSLAAALEAAQAMMSRPEAAPFMALIDLDTVVMRHNPVLLAVE